MPVAARAKTRRTLVSSTACRCPYANEATAAAVYSPIPGSASSWRVLARYVAAVPFRYRLRGPVQPQRAARIAEPAPGADRLAGRLGGQVGGAGPAGEPLLVHRQDPAHRGLLQHELADHHPPGARFGAAPGQIAGVLLEPPDDGGVEGGGGGGRLGGSRSHGSHGTDDPGTEGGSGVTGAGVSARAAAPAGANATRSVPCDRVRRPAVRDDHRQNLMMIGKTCDRSGGWGLRRPGSLVQFGPWDLCAIRSGRFPPPSTGDGGRLRWLLVALLALLVVWVVTSGGGGGNKDDGKPGGTDPVDVDHPGPVRLRARRSANSRAAATSRTADPTAGRLGGSGGSNGEAAPAATRATGSGGGAGSGGTSRRRGHGRLRAADGDGGPAAPRRAAGPGRSPPLPDCDPAHCSLTLRSEGQPTARTRSPRSS